MPKNAKGNDYFAMFASLVGVSCQAAQFLSDTLTNYDASKLHDALPQMHDIEHGADVEKHHLMEKLVKEFLPPIEREDIILLAQAVDDVTDKIEDVLIRMYMFNITVIRPHALQFCQVILSCCQALQEVMNEFHNFRRSTSLPKLIIEVNRLEEDGDQLYTQAMRELYTSGSDPVEIISWTETYHYLERCCDACEEVANIVESVMMKNA